MAESKPTGPRWDVHGLGFGLVIGLLGLTFLVGRTSEGLRPVHLLGIIVLGAGAALLLAAVDRPPSPAGAGAEPHDD